ISWYDFAIAIKEVSGSDCIVKPIPTSQYPTPARRPAFSVLDTQKVQDVYGVEMKNWKESLKVCLRNLL
ncbi:MAG TPA: sugar nucleotide-binding protein, partial [Saprospiraceae bacterium]|nr:sugar nucleotide-binding protein [Saprospiraceae bacterium]